MTFTRQNRYGGITIMKYTSTVRSVQKPSGKPSPRKGGRRSRDKKLEEAGEPAYLDEIIAAEGLIRSGRVRGPARTERFRGRGSAQGRRIAHPGNRIVQEDGSR